jgi:hypothetical protein
MRNRVHQDGFDELGGHFSFEGNISSEHFEKDDTQRINITKGIERISFL